MGTKTDLCRRLRAGLELTPGERLRIYRRDRNLSQLQLAKRYRVRLDHFRAWEEDIGEVPDIYVIMAELSLGELIDIHRRRLGATLQEIADALEMGLTWTHKAARGHSGAERVVEYLFEVGGEG